MAALTEPAPSFVRSHLLITLWHLVAGEPHAREIEAGLELLDSECQERAREGLWIIYQEAVSGDTETALDILEFIELDNSRLEYFRNALGWQG